MIALLGCLGLSPVLYYFISVIKKKGSYEYDEFVYLNWGSRRIWAHWHSVLSSFLGAHYLFTGDNPSIVIYFGIVLNLLNVIFAFFEHSGYSNNFNADHNSCILCGC